MQEEILRESHDNHESINALCGRGLTSNQFWEYIRNGSWKWFFPFESRVKKIATTYLGNLDMFWMSRKIIVQWIQKDFGYY